MESCFASKILSAKPLSIFKPQKSSPSKTMLSSSSLIQDSSRGALLPISAFNLLQEVRHEYDAAAAGPITKRIKLFGTYIDVPVPQDNKDSQDSQPPSSGIKLFRNYINDPRPALGTRLPVEFKDRIHSLNQGLVLYGEVLVIDKDLKDSDIQKEQNRFSIPHNQMKNMFLRDEEISYLKRREDGKKKNTNKLEVKLIDPMMNQWSVKLGVWQMKNDFYAINGSNWSKIVSSNNLKKGDRMQLWAIRVGGDDCLWFALLRLPNDA